MKPDLTPSTRRQAPPRASATAAAVGISRHGKLPLYVQFASLLRTRIDQGDWPIGHCLPALSALAAQFSVAVITVRQAIALLESEGLLERRQGAGTFVIGRTAAADWLRLGATWSALLTQLQDVGVQVINRDVSDLQPRLQPAEGRPAAQYRCQSRLHQRDHRPFCLMDLYLDEAIHRLDPERFDRELVLPAMTQLVGERISRAWQTVRVAKADPWVATQLGLDVGDPIAKVRRLVVDRDDVVMYLAEIVYRGDVLRIDMNLLDHGAPREPDRLMFT